MRDERASTDLITVETAPNCAAAELIAGILRGAEIPVYVAGSLLQDEWAIARKLAGLLAVEVQVPRAYLVEAREALAEARGGAAELEVEAEEKTPVEPPGPPKPPELQTHAITEGMLWLETLVVLLVFILAMSYQSVDAFLWPAKPIRYTVVQSYLWRFIADIPNVALVLYLIARSGEPWSRFGFRDIRCIGDPVLCCVIYLAQELAYRAFIPFLLWIFGDGFLAPNGDTAPWAVAVPTNFGTYLVVALSTIMSAFEEELLMRGYLLPRFEQLLKSTWAGLFLTAILFGSYHAYQGMGAVLVTALIGLVYGFAFCLTRRLLPIVAAHGLHNLFSILA